MPELDGTIVAPNTDGVLKVGVWLMPDNEKPGELEGFLAALVPPCDDVWELAQRYVEQVPSDQISKPAKARIHAWLAVRTVGGRLGTSISAGASGPSGQELLRSFAGRVGLSGASPRPSDPTGSLRRCELYAVLPQSRSRSRRRHQPD